MIIKTDCRFFEGDIPCKPHKQFGYHCSDCPSYQKTQNKILIIKLGAIGDVIRTTPVLRKLREVYQSAQITWISDYPEILPAEWIDRILNVSAENIHYLNQIKFDWLINLDKDRIAISLAQSIAAEKKSGFGIDEYGRAKPFSAEAENHKWLTGIFDDLSKQNTKHYVEEVFDIIGYKFNAEDYILENKEMSNWDLDYSKKIVGLNTGCGGRWTSRLWPDEYWIELSKNLINNGYEVVLLGGEQEHEKNLFLSSKSSAKYPGHFPLKKFISLVDQCTIVVTAVTMAMHIAMGLKKKVIIFNNIFNSNEFYLYGRGEILEPQVKCECYYSPVCPHDSMKSIYPESVFNKIKELLG
jgi:heptosyltransferase-2